MRRAIPAGHVPRVGGSTSRFGLVEPSRHVVFVADLSGRISAYRGECRKGKAAPSVNLSVQGCLLLLTKNL